MVWLALQGDQALSALAVLWTDAQGDRRTKPVLKCVRLALDAAEVA